MFIPSTGPCLISVDPPVISGFVVNINRSMYNNYVIIIITCTTSQLSDRRNIIDNNSMKNGYQITETLIRLLKEAVVIMGLICTCIIM